MEQGNPGVYAPSESSAPSDAAAPFAPHDVSPHYVQEPAPSGVPGAGRESEPQPEWTSQVSAAEERARAVEAENAQFRQAFGELQQMAARAQAEQAQQQQRSEAQARLDQAYAVAADMDPETALQYVKRVEDAEKAHLLRMMNEQEAQAQARLERTVSQIAVPQYAKARGQELGIPDKYVEQLAGVPAHLIDALLPFVQQFAQQEQSFTQQLEQLGRSTRAGEMAASGAFNPSGNGASPSPPQSAKFDPNSPEFDRRALLARYLQNKGLLRSR